MIKERKETRRARKVSSKERAVEILPKAIIPKPKEKERMTKESLRASPKRTRLAITAGRKGILLVTVRRSSSARSDCCS